MKWLWFTFLVVFSSSLRAIEYVEADFLLFERDMPGLNKNGFDHYRDSQGFYWLATAGGIYRYDGTRLEAVFENPSNGPIANTDVYQFVEHNGYLWASSYSGLFKIDLNSYQVELFQATTQPHSLANNNVRYLSKDAQNRLWASTLTGLSLYRPKTGRFKNYYLSATPKGMDYNLAFRRVASDAKANVWAASYEQGLQVLVTGSEQLKPIAQVASLSAEQAAWFGGGNTLDVVSLSSGNVGIVLPDRYIEFDANFTIRHNILIPAHHKIPDKKAMLYRIAEDKKQRIWLTSFNGALIRVSKDRKTLEYHYHRVQDKAHTLRNEYPFRINVDGQGEIALSYANNNYQYWSVVNDLIKKIKLTEKHQVDSSVEISRVIDGRYVWLGFRHNSKIYLLDLKNNHIKSYDVKMPVQSFAGVDNSKVYIATRNEGAYLFDVAQHKKSKVSSLAIGNIDYAQETGLWVNTERLIYRFQNGKSYSYELRGEATLLGAHIHSDKTWGTWLSTPTSIYYFDHLKDQFIRLQEDNLNLVNGTRISLHNNSLWIPGNGLIRLDLERTDKGIRVKQRHQYAELKNEVIFNVITGGKSLWFNNATGERVYKLNSQSHHILRFDIKEGFPRKSATQVLAFSPQGGLLISEMGVVSVLEKPEALSPQAKVASQIVSYGILNNNQNWQNNFRPANSVQLNADEQTIRFNFSDMSSLSSTTFPEEYRLLGRSPRWIRASSRTAVYSGLEPGNYTFELRNTWNKSVVNRIHLSVSAPIWQTKPAYVLYFLLVALIIGFIVYLRWDKARAQRQSEAQIRLYAKAFESAAEGFCVVDERSRVLNSNQSFKALLGADVSSLLSCRSGQVSRYEYAQSWKDMLAEGAGQGKIWCRSREGRDIPVSYKGSIIDGYEGGQPLYMLVLSDMSEQYKHEQELQTMSNYDSLTSLPNRNLFREKLRTAINNCHHITHKKFGVLYLNIDRFKSVNDSLSYHYGDKLLVEIAKKLQRSLRPQDSLCRLGGDEFVAIIENIDSQEVLGSVSNKLIRTAEQPMNLAGRNVFVSLSIGISVYPDDSQNPDELIKKADAAMFSAKSKGGGSYSYFTAGMSSRMRTALKLESDIRQAARREEFEPYFQAKVDLQSGKMTGVEALVRWCKPDGTVVLPGVFIDAAERTGAIVKIGLSVLHKSCQLLESWHQQGINALKIAVNISAHQLAQDDFIERLQSLIEQYDFDAKMLEFEITESILMADKSDSVLKLSILRKMGHSISVDDFGTGYSSLSYLTELPIDTLKIDRSFVKNMFSDSKQQSVVKTIIELSNNLGLQVVAEGVETLEDHEKLKQLGCHSGQGYWYGKPMAVEQLIKSDLFLHSKSVERLL